MDAPARILVIDDERHIRELLEIGLADDGYDVASAADGQIGLQLTREWAPDAIVLDVMMPKIDGVTLLPMLRKITEAPIVMLSAKGETGDKLAGLHAGADDYVTKPFELDELTARLQVALRRPRLAQPQVLRFSDLEINLETRVATRAGKRIALSAREYDLLVVLLRNPNRVLVATSCWIRSGVRSVSSAPAPSRRIFRIYVRRSITASRAVSFTRIGVSATRYAKRSSCFASSRRA